MANLKTEKEESYIVNITQEKNDVGIARDLKITVGGKKIELYSMVIHPINPDGILTATIEVPISFCGE